MGKRKVWKRQGKERTKKFHLQDCKSVKKSEQKVESHISCFLADALLVDCESPGSQCSVWYFILTSLQLNLS